MVFLGFHLTESLNITILEQSSYDFDQSDKSFANDVIINSLRTDNPEGIDLKFIQDMFSEKFGGEWAVIYSIGGDLGYQFSISRLYYVYLTHYDTYILIYCFNCPSKRDRFLEWKSIQNKLNLFTW